MRTLNLAAAASRRLGRHMWTFNLPPNSGKNARSSSRCTLRRHNDYCRNLRQRAAPQADTSEEVKPADGTGPCSAGEDDIAPEMPEWPLSRRPRLSAKGNPGLPFSRATPAYRTGHQVLTIRMKPRASPISRRQNARALRIKTKNSRNDIAKPPAEWP